MQLKTHPIRQFRSNRYSEGLAFKAELISQLQANVVLKLKKYLGTIHHTLPTIPALGRRDMQVPGMVFKGRNTSQTEYFIQQYPSRLFQDWRRAGNEQSNCIKVR